MRLFLEIPEEFEHHFDNDRFRDSLERLKADADTVAGNYEKELCDMLINAFAGARVSRIAQGQQLNHPNFDTRPKIKFNSDDLSAFKGM